MNGIVISNIRNSHVKVVVNENTESSSFACWIGDCGDVEYMVKNLNR